MVNGIFDMICPNPTPVARDALDYASDCSVTRGYSRDN